MRKARWKEEHQKQRVGHRSLEDQLQWLEHYASSKGHFEHTPTNYYGEHDPFDVPFSACADCGSEQLKLWTPREGRAAWRVICTCGNTGPASEFPRKAIFRWNKSRRSRDTDFQLAPLFQLRGLSRADATDRLLKIQNDLGLRVELANVRQSVRADVSPGYIAKLVAYFDWTQYLIDLIKRTSQTAEKPVTNTDI